ncbi:hypothetical protein FXO38_11534, partial [Capsicum annuum]
RDYFSFGRSKFKPGDTVEGHRALLDTFIDEHSGHVDNMFNEMSTGVFTEEVEETSSASILVGNLDNIQSTKVLDESIHSCCHKVIAEVQPNTPNKMLDEATLCLERNEVQLFDECSPRNMSKRYVNTTSLDRSSSKQKIEFETFDDMYLADFFMEPETEYLSLDKVFMGNGDDIPTSEIPADKVIPDVKRGKSTDFAKCVVTDEMVVMESKVDDGHGIKGVPASYATGSCLDFVYIFVGCADEFINLVLHYVLEPGDKIIACLPTLSLYEFAALESCKNDHWYLNMIGSELEYGAAMGLSLLERFSDRLTLVLQ